MSMTIYPKTSAWALLLVPTSPITCLGVYAICTGVILEGLIAVMFAAFIVLYNASARLVVNGESMSFRRYGFEVWRMPKKGTIVENGKGGDFNFLPAYIFDNGSIGSSNFILKGWFDDGAIDRLRISLD